MKNFYLMAIVVALLCLTSCGDNPTLDSLVAGKSVVDNTVDPLNPNDGQDGQDGQDGDDGSDGDSWPAGDGIFYQEIASVELATEDYSAMGALPYKTKKFPIVSPIQLDAPVDEKFPWDKIFKKDDSCGEHGQHKCIKNSQVVFGFEIPPLDWDAAKILDIKIRANVFSHWRNWGTEILCLLNTKSCSGSAIRETPELLQWLIKNREPDFWDGGESILKNSYFMNIIRYGEDRGQKVYYVKDALISLRSLLNLTEDEMRDLLFNERLYFVIADDTMISTPSLHVKYTQR